MKFEKSIPILYSKDVSKSIVFYTDKLGFDEKWEWDDPPTFGGVSKGEVEIFFSEKGQGNPGTWLFIVVDDVDEYYEGIKTNGAKIVAPPNNREWNMRELVVEDPDGHIIRFGQRIECD